jgi:hypothetical protein
VASETRDTRSVATVEVSGTQKEEASMKPETICLAPKAKPAANSWWACSYPTRAGWYQAALAASERLKGAKKVYASDCDTARFSDYWKKPKADERPYVEDEAEQVA